MFGALQPTMRTMRALGRPTLEGNLVARHLVLDDLLEAAVAERRVGQVVEIACGLSGRGLRFSRRHPDLDYVEADLPGMVANKRRALGRAGGAPERHRLAELDAFADHGPGSIAELAAGLDPGLGVAFITEGLLNYFDRDAVIGLWERIAAAMQRFPSGVYLSDIYLGSEHTGLLSRAGFAAISLFVRGRMHVHFADDAEAVRALRDAGFGPLAIHHCDEHPSAAGRVEPAGARLVRVIEARSG